ncbi:unnamed protein product [Cyprideis torosa]|uniref:Uncharacterized protein n=1 Tax=Cyprideis torosa TaxID=163714 RepID=A0A7R8WH37_9CRUS|nr:unnamed protein product [Cyprideis torosa]CAG0898916.1 unnamed protein product [Cyprideis torosa]
MNFLSSSVLFFGLLAISDGLPANAGSRPAVHRQTAKHHLKILGGEEAALGDFPYQASIQLYLGWQFGWRHVCGGVILNENLILTTGSCTIGRLDEQLPEKASPRRGVCPNQQRPTVEVGFITLSEGDDEPTMQQLLIDEIIIHPDFAYNVLTGQVRNDIAIFSLNGTFDLSGEAASPIALPPAGVTLDVSSKCVASGWGTEEFGIIEEPSNELLYIHMDLFEDDYCENLYDTTWDLYVPGEMLCAGLAEGGGGTCTGDRGGPLVCKGDDGNAYLFGLTSFFDSTCGAESGHPEVFTEVPPYVAWIQEVMAQYQTPKARKAQLKAQLKAALKSN